MKGYAIVSLCSREGNRILINTYIWGMEIANIPLEEVGGGGGGAKYPNIGSDPGSQLAAASKRVPLRIFPLMRFPDTHESYSLNGSSPFNSLYFREIGCNVNGIQIKQRSWCQFWKLCLFSAATKCSSPSSMQCFAIDYAAEARSFYARSSSFKTQTGFCISLWYINTMQWFVKVNENLKYAFLSNLSHWCFRDLTDTTLAIKDANSKLVDVIMLMLTYWRGVVMLMPTYWRGRLVTANSLTTSLHRLHSFHSFCQNSGLACCSSFVVRF